MADLDAERRLAQALRAQAAQAGGLPVSGSVPPAPPAPRRPGVSPGWVLVLALVLGLLAGAVAGLVTVL